MATLDEDGDDTVVIFGARRGIDGRMETLHVFTCTESPGGFLYECRTEGCGRRLVVDRAGEMTVIDRGDQFARHRGHSGGVNLGRPTLGQA